MLQDISRSSWRESRRDAVEHFRDVLLVTRREGSLGASAPTMPDPASRGSIENLDASAGIVRRPL